jgi:hypothetical protein
LRTINVGANNAEANNDDASPLRISTMTVQVKYTPATDIPLVPFQTAFFDSVVQEEWIPEFFGSGTLKLQKKQDSFYNCILFTHTDAVADAGNDDADADAGAGAKPKKTAIKLFCNGTLHITGLSDIRAVVDVAKRFTAFISRLTYVQLKDAKSGAAVSARKTLRIDYRVPGERGHFTGEVPMQVPDATSTNPSWIVR